MESAWKTVTIFISSTFNDMRAERDFLVKKVFPKLSAMCEERKLRLVDIDLRWGVSEKDATENKRVVQVCLDRINDCRPFFLCFLGQRRGWVPLRTVRLAAVRREQAAKELLRYRTAYRLSRGQNGIFGHGIVEEQGGETYAKYAFRSFFRL